jgi:hypothetical protein
MDVWLLPEQLLLLPWRNAPQLPGVCCRTMPALPANPQSALVARRPGASRLLKQARPDLFPGDDVGRVLLMPCDAGGKLRPLRVGESQRVGFQALPHHVQQFRLFRSGEAVYFMS